MIKRARHKAHPHYNSPEILPRKLGYKLGCATGSPVKKPGSNYLNLLYNNNNEYLAC